MHSVVNLCNVVVWWTDRQWTALCEIDVHVGGLFCYCYSPLLFTGHLVPPFPTLGDSGDLLGQLRENYMYARIFLWGIVKLRDFWSTGPPPGGMYGGISGNSSRPGAEKN